MLSRILQNDPISESFEKESRHFYKEGHQSQEKHGRSRKKQSLSHLLSMRLIGGQE